jgi:hypothetical protein
MNDDFHPLKPSWHRWMVVCEVKVLKYVIISEIPWSHFGTILVVAPGRMGFSVLNEHQVLVSGGWEHYQIKKGQSQTHLFLIQKYQSRFQLVEAGHPHQSTHLGFSLL